MSIAFILIIVVAFFLLLLFAIDAKVRLLFDTDHNDMHVSVYWLYPFIRGIGKIGTSGPVLDIYLFRKHLLRKIVKPNQGKVSIKKTDLLKVFRLRNLSINTKYGFADPSTTGITCGAFNAALQFINIDFINQIPDFMSAHDYIYFDAKANVNLGASLTNLIKYYKNRRNLQWIRTQA